MNSVIERINEIKSRFSPRRQNIIPNEDSFQKTLNKTIDDDSNDLTNNSKSNDLSIDKIKEIAKDYADINKVPPSLVNAVIKTESDFNPFAISPKGARGLMQLMPTTIKDLGISDPFNVHENLMGGVSHLRRLLEKYNWDYKKALAAYNAGETAVDKNGGIPPYKETRQYVKKVINAYLMNVK